MTIKEFKIELEKYPEDIRVYLYDGEYDDCYSATTVKPIYDKNETGKLLFIVVD